MAEDTTPDVEIRWWPDHADKAERGVMLIGPNATAADIQRATSLAESVGFEAEDPFETGDEYELDEQGRIMVQLYRLEPVDRQLDEAA